MITMTRLAPLAAPLALLAALTLSAPAAAQSAGTLTVCTEASPDGFDIVQYESAVTNDAAGLTVFDQLLTFKPGTTELAPGLAQSWSVSPDGLQVTLKLRPGVKFHSTPWFTPTRDFNADDVLFSIQRMNDKKHWAHGVARNGYIYWEGMGMSSLVKAVDKLDPLTVRFTLSRPEAPFLANLAMDFTMILSAEYAAALLKAGQPEGLDEPATTNGSNGNGAKAIGNGWNSATADRVPQIFGPVLIMPGQRFRLPFAQAGSYSFDCQAHASGQMKVEVAETPAPGLARLRWRLQNWNKEWMR